MYIHKKYLINNKCADVKEYKSSLKEICKLNLRRSSKFNILAILGALRCVDKSILSGNTGIYIGSEYCSMNSVKKVLEEVSADSIIMPFDFLNINSNNVSFYVSQALESKGKNMLLTSEELSFERGLEMALFDLEINDVDDALVGLVDESLDNIKEYNKYISNTNNLPSNDYSGWLYMNKLQENSLAQIESLYQFNSMDQMNKMISSINFDIMYTKLDCIGCIISFIDSLYERMMYVKIDKNNRGYIILVIK